jgi:hypothetical protein
MVFAEALTEYLADGLSEALAKAEKLTRPDPLPTDRYVALSALQKAIRRGEEDLALTAAMNLMIGGPQAIWRRLAIIAFEDIGVANIDVVGWATVVIGDRELRARLGGEWKVMEFLVRALCRSAKNRATDELTYLIEHSPALADVRDELPGLSLRWRIAAATDTRSCISVRALATWFSIGTDRITSSALAPVPGCLENTFGALRDAGCPGTAVEIGRMGLKRTGCILAAMLPSLYWLRGTGEYSVEDDLILPETKIGPVPSWVFDMHTRSGLAAFGLYRRRSARMRAYLTEHADPSANLTRLIGYLVFAIESGLLRKRMIWPEGVRLRMAADLVQPGLPPEVVPDAFAILRDEIDLLNRCRAEAAPDYLR